MVPRKCPNRQGEPTCYNEACANGCVRNFRDQPASDIPLSSFVDKETVGRHEPPHQRSRVLRVLGRVLG